MSNIRKFNELVIMITKVLIENFKAFKKAEIQIKPITILVGPNNGGKTSILQSIGLIQQTFKKNGLNVLNFKEPQNLGDFDNLVHQDSNNKEIRFRFEFEESTYFDFKIVKKNDQISVNNFACDNGRFEYILENLKRMESIDEFAYKPDKFNVNDINIKKHFRNNKPIFYRDSFFFKFRSFLPDGNIEDILSTNKRKKFVKKENDKKEMIDFYLSIISSNFHQDIKKQFNNIRYIGPIRAEAERFYEDGSFFSVGFHGEHAVQMIANDSALMVKTQKILRDLHIADILEVSGDDNSINFELKLMTDITNKAVNFSDVGCGTSQILPLIVQSLLAKEESLMLIEQPEIHLHPKVQADLANFFVNASKLKTNFLIETHSEHIIERIRTLIMKNPSLSNDVIIYYVEQNKEKKCSEITPIKINANGQYSEKLPANYLNNFRLEEIDTQMEIMLKNIKNEIGSKNDN